MLGRNDAAVRFNSRFTNDPSLVVWHSGQAMDGGVDSSVTMCRLDASAILTESKEVVRAGHSKRHSCTVYIGRRMRPYFSKALLKQPHTIWNPLEHRKSASEWGLGIEISRVFSDDPVSVITQG